jgi:hypothetical protein
MRRFPNIGIQLQREESATELSKRYTKSKAETEKVFDVAV